MTDFKNNVLNAIISDLKNNPHSVALWEGGSAANGTSDQYSDIDILIIARDSTEVIFNLIEVSLNKVSCVSQKYTKTKSFWPGCFQKIYFLENAPKYFFVDITVILQTSEELLSELCQIERHGNLIIHFDKLNLVKMKKTDLITLKNKQRRRLEEIETAFPVYKITVLKELDRGNVIDAYAFYFSGVIQPLVELLGMIHRPFKFDFGLRYLHKNFPESDQQVIKSLIYVGSKDDMKERLIKAEKLFEDTRLQVHKIIKLT